MAQRDVRLEMNLTIRRELNGRLVNAEGAGSVAEDLVRRLRAEDPALLLGWLQAHAVETLGRHIARRHPAPLRTGPRKNAARAASVSKATKASTEAQPLDAAA